MDRLNYWWKPFTPRDNTWYRWLLAGAEIFVRRDKGGAGTAGSARPGASDCSFGARQPLWRALCRDKPWESRSGGCSGPLEADAPEGKAALARGDTEGPVQAALRPFLPARPFLVKLDGRLHLLPGAEYILNPALPPLLKLAVMPESREAGEPEEPFLSFTPFAVKETWYGDTWYGDTMKGVHCFSLGVNTEEAESDAPSSGAEIHCRMLIRNRTRSTLEPEALPLHGGEFSVYEDGDRLVSDEAVIDIYGEGDFRVTVHAPEGGRLLASGSKSGVGDMLIHHGTRIIKNITGLG